MSVVGYPRGASLELRARFLPEFYDARSNLIISITNSKMKNFHLEFVVREKVSGVFHNLKTKKETIEAHVIDMRMANVSRKATNFFSDSLCHQKAVKLWEG